MSLLEKVSKSVKIAGLAGALLGATMLGCSNNNNPTSPKPTPTPSIITTGTPSMSVTYVPPIGSSDEFAGTVNHLQPADYVITGYDYVPNVGGWWVKPTTMTPYVKINSDGSWSFDYDTGRYTGGYDEYSTQVAFFLIPASQIPNIPIVENSATLPNISFAVAQTIVNRN